LKKRRFRDFLIYVTNYDENKISTYQNRDLNNITMKQLYDEFGLSPNTQAFIGHAMALQRDDDYINLKAISTVKQIQLYSYSLERYGKSPYIYPLWGLGGLPEGFSRLCAINNGTFMLNKNIDEILFDKDGCAYGVRSGNEIAKATMVVGDPSYFPSEKTRIYGRVIRSIFILDHPISDTNNSDSLQLIIPAKQISRTNDIYICMISNSHQVCSKNKFIAIVSTTIETNNPIREIDVAVNLIGNYLERFDAISDLYEPVDDGLTDRCFISKSYDATSHFETAADDVLSLYERITGTKLDMTINADTTETEDY